MGITSIDVDMAFTEKRGKGKKRGFPFACDLEQDEGLLWHILLPRWPPERALNTAVGAAENPPEQ